jgi:chromate reductase
MTTIIAGTNRPESYTLKLASYYQRKLKEKGFNTGLLSLAELPESLIHTDLYNNDHNPEFQPIQDIVTATDKFLFVIPEYNGSFPGIFKFFIDTCKFPESFSGKKAALLGLSTGKYGNVRGVDHFTGVCHYINLHILPLVLHIPYIHKELDENGNLFKEDTLRFTAEQMDRFIAF